MVRRDGCPGQWSNSDWKTPFATEAGPEKVPDTILHDTILHITLTHTQRYHAQTRTVGYGHIYQGRYKSLPVEMGGHFMTLVRYVERNAKRAALVKKAEDWPWSSVSVRLHGDEAQKTMLSPWPVAEPKDYLEWLNHSQPKEEIENIRYAIKRSRPYGSERWVSRAVAEFGLENTIRNPWRPGKGT